MSFKNILILYDFTEKAEKAILHGINIAQNFRSTATLLHILHNPKLDIEKLDEEKRKIYKNEISQKLIDRSNSLSKEYRVKVNSKVCEGNIFTDISPITDDFSTDLIIMGTHGITGIQQFIGSNVVRLTANCTVPFLIVQKELKKQLYNKILVPVDFHEETNELYKALVSLSSKYDSEIHLICNHRPNKAIQNLIEENMHSLVNKLKEKNIKSIFRITEPSPEPFAHKVLEYGNGIGADLITMLGNQGRGLTDFFLIQFMQNLIANPYHIPVLCVSFSKK